MTNRAIKARMLRALAIAVEEEASNNASNYLGEEHTLTESHAERIRLAGMELAEELRRRAAALGDLDVRLLNNPNRSEGHA